MATHRATLSPRRARRAPVQLKRKPSVSARAETVACAASRSQQGHSVNQDAFHVERGAAPWVAVADGEGEAATCAKTALGLLGERMAVGDGEAWERWRTEIAAALPAGTSCAWAAARLVGGRWRGCCGPGLRVALLAPGTGSARWLANGGAIVVFDEAAHAGETCLLFTDGAWRLLPEGWEAALAAVENPWSRPAALLDLAARSGRPDDMSVALLRRG